MHTPPEFESWMRDGRRRDLDGMMAIYAEDAQEHARNAAHRRTRRYT
jgi:hypothetical protein